MTGKGLGIGLGALLGETAVESENSDTKYIPIARIEPKRDQPRKNFDQESIEELAESIKEYGLIQPITVRKTEENLYEIVAGERRWRAARLAGLIEVPVRIVEADDKRTMELALVENLQREDLNPVEEAEGYRALIENYGLTQEETAKRIGKSRPAVANTLRLLSLEDSVVEMLRNGELTEGHARALLQIKDKKQQAELAQRVISEGLSVRQTEAIAKKPVINGKNQEIKSDKKEDIYIRDVEEKLTKKLGRKVLIKKGKKKGRFEIEYYSDDDLEQLIEALGKIEIGKGGVEEC